MSVLAGMTLEDVESARELLRGVSRVTPLEGSRPLSEQVGGPVHLKCENLQRAGSFKIRGAYVRIARLSPEERARGVVAASAGNHAQGVALASSMLGIRTTVFMPVGASLPKVTATRAYGADVILEGHTIEQSLAAATAFSVETGAVLIHPFDHRDIVAGQGTMGLEILEQCPERAHDRRVPRRRWAARRYRVGGEGGPAGHTHRRCPGRGRGLLAAVARGRAARAAGVDVDDGRRDRGRPSG